MGKDATGEGFVAVTPSDTVNIAKNSRGAWPRALRFGTGGTAVLVGTDDSVGTFTNIADGETIDCDVKRINATGSSGIANIVGIY